MTEHRPDVALFLPSFAGGGAEQVMVDLAAAFERSGRRVHMVLVEADGPLLARVPEGVEIVDLAATRTAKAVVPLARYLRRQRPRVLLSTLGHANVVALLASRASPGTRVLVREANTVSRDVSASTLSGRMLRLLMRWLYGSADAVVAPSHGVASDLRQRLGLSADKIVVIPNPVLTDRVWTGAKAAPDQTWFPPPPAKVIVSVGRLTEQKGFDTLIRAFAEARSVVPCHLVILGDGEHHDDLQRLARSLGVADQVVMPGFVANPFPFIANARAFVLSSRWEGLPNVLIQATALGVPIVSTDCESGPAEILDGGKLGRLVPVDDVPAMATAIVAALGEGRRQPPDDWLRRYRPEDVARAYLHVIDGREGPP